MTAERVTIAAARSSWLLACVADGLRPSTIKTYRSLSGHFVERFGILDVRGVPSSSIREFVIARRALVALTSAIDEVVALKVFFGWCSREYENFRDPMTNIRRPRAPRLQPRAASFDSVLALLSTCPNTALGLRDRAILLTFIDTGIRASELLGIKNADFDYSRGRIVVTGKGDKTRVVPVSPFTELAIARWLVKRPPGATHVFCNLGSGVEGQPLLYPGLRQMFRRRSAAAGLSERVTAHQLRHLFSGHYMDKGGSITRLRDILGHSDISVTARYARYQIDDLQAGHAERSPVARISGGAV